MTELELVGELSVMRVLLEEIRDAVAEPFGEIADWRRAEWAAGKLDDVDLGDVFGGVLIVNEAAGDAYVGFGPGTGTLLGRVLTVPQGGVMQVRFRCSQVSIGGPVAGAAVVAPLIAGRGRG